MELKSPRLLPRRTKKLLFKSHLYGIEIVLISLKTLAIICLNRTFMELKLVMPVAVS